MEQKVYFPINCSLSPITITTNYGEPYPNQKFFSLREQRILFDIASLIRSYESNYSSFKQNYPNLPQNLSSITDRILLLEFIVNTNPQKLNFA
ncbi:MAG: M23 family peptidase, partial [Candidatus Aenigmatarchaeota archaeon]